MTTRKRKNIELTPEDLLEIERMEAEYRAENKNTAATHRRPKTNRREVSFAEFADAVMPIVGFFVGFVAALTRSGKGR